MDCCKDEKKHDNHKEKHGSHDCGCGHGDKHEHSSHEMKSMGEQPHSSHKH